ncbi:MAG: CO/xanthine dehydrogenase Mo-binding subunit [Gammaproteobacteria bacterium]|jgi:CO/xanthine dehydrogenase Mo-binding subunit
MQTQAQQTTDYKWIGKRTLRPDGVDKVTGRAAYGADYSVPDMLVGQVLRSPHAHARIISIDTSKAQALAGVKAVITAVDFPLIPSDRATKGTAPVNFCELSDNMMARHKVLYEGHAVAAVAATSALIAKRALALIDVQYEVLPHVIDVEEAMQANAPLLHDTMFTQGVEPKPASASNVAKRVEFAIGDLEAGFAAADFIVEETFTTKPVHQGYIEPHAVVADTSEDGQSKVWSSSQGHFMIRQYCAGVLEMNVADIRVTPAEIGGGFGAKTTVWLEPHAVLLSRKAGRAVKMTMNRDDVFRATGPTSGSAMTVKIGCTKEGRITAAQAELKFQAGAYPGSPVQIGCMCAFTCYDVENVQVVGFDVVTNRPKAVAYRAPGAPIAAFAVESLVDKLAQQIGMDPIAFRELNAAREGTRTSYGPTLGVVGFQETLDAAKNHPHYSAKLGPNQGRGVATGYWFNVGGETSCAVSVLEDGTVMITSGSPDVGGSRASLVIMAAEVLGIDVDQVRAVIADTSSLGFNRHTGGSRVTFAAGMMVIQATEDMIVQMRERAAQIWDIDVDAVDWRDGAAHPAGANAGKFEPLGIKDIAGKTAAMTGPINAKRSANVQAPGPAFATHIVDVEVDPKTGAVKILRYTAIQDAGRAIHPSYVEGQMQGGVVQGIGWALNEEYIYNKQGRMENPGFLDYRMPVASDLPMIDTVIVEVPNPSHPFGVRGVGEVPIIPPMAAIANAIDNAVGLRLTDLPMSPPRVLAALEAMI